MVSIILIWLYSNTKVCTAKVAFALLVIEDSGLQFYYLLPPVNFSYNFICSYPEYKYKIAASLLRLAMTACCKIKKPLPAYKLIEVKVFA